MAPLKLNLKGVKLEMQKKAAFFCRVARKWSMPFQNRELGIRSVELVLIDEEGTRIQATVPQEHIPLFNDQIEEGGLYAFMHFTVKENVGKWRPTQHPYRFYFNEITKVKAQPDDKHPLFPLSTYKFTSFTDVLNSPNVDGPDLIDIIGAYNPTDPPKKPLASEGPSTWCSFQLRDLENKILNCTLWNEYVGQFDRYLSTPRADPVIVLLQLCRINKRWDDTKGVATSFYVSKLLLDEHIPEIELFRSRFLSMRASFSSPLTQSSSSSVVSVDAVNGIGLTIPLSELSSSKEVRGCWVYGQISTIISWKTWAYLGCDEPRCFKKVTKDNGHLHCVNCRKQTSKGIWRYSLRLRVSHNCANVEFMFWDSESQRLLGKAAGDFTTHLDVERLAPKSLPVEIKQLVGREFMFKIDKAHENNSSGGMYYSIAMVSDDQEKLEQVKTTIGLEPEAYNSDEDLELLSYSTTGVESSMTQTSLDNENVPTPHSSISKRGSEDGHLGSEVCSTQGSATKKQKTIKLEMP